MRSAKIVTERCALIGSVLLLTLALAVTGSATARNNRLRDPPSLGMHHSACRWNLPEQTIANQQLSWRPRREGHGCNLVAELASSARR